MLTGWHPRIFCDCFCIFVFFLVVLTASEHNDRGIELATSDPVTDETLFSALKHFQTATVAEPTIAEYHNNVGVTYMRLKQFKKAKKAFETALEIEPQHGIYAYFFMLCFVGVRNIPYLT